MKKFITFTLISLLVLLCSNTVYATTKKTQVDTNRRLEYINFDFWKNFNDENLVNDLNTVYQSNHDLKATNYKVNEAQRLVKISLANELPQISFQGYVGQTFKSSDEVFGDVVIPDYTQSHFLLPLSLNYEIDIWGKNHLMTKSQKKRFEMVEQDEKSTYILLTSAFASDYFNLIKSDKLIEYQKQLVDLQTQIVESLKYKYQYGTATIDQLLASEKALTYLREDLQNMLEKQDVLQNQMSVMLSDRGFTQIPRSSYDSLKFDMNTPTEIDVKVLSDRPDWVRSELDIERIGIDVKVAKRNLLPKFVINGNIGFNMYSSGSSHNFLADIGVVPMWDLFAGGRKIQTVKLHKDAYKVATEHYEKVILASMQETNDALYQLKTIKEKSLIAQDRLKTDIQLYNNIADKNKLGIANNIDLLYAKEAEILSKKQVVSNNINKLIAMINLYQAVGGKNYFESL